MSNGPATLQAAVALANKIATVTAQVLERHIGRGDVVKATFLALITGRPGFFYGPPGVDKTGTVQDLARRIAGAIFHEELMTTVVSPEQLLVESTAIEEEPTPTGGKLIRTRDTLGRAAKAHIFFADEIWKALERVLQALIDLSKGDGVRWDGQMIKTPLLAFLAASNELPDPESNLGAMWSRMTIRVKVEPLDRQGKLLMATARLRKGQGATTIPAQLTLAEIETLRAARPLVQVPPDIVETLLNLYQALAIDAAVDFTWLWADDRRFGRCLDVLQAHALLSGRSVVTKADLGVLEWLLWDAPEQIPTVKAALAPYCRTPLGDANELFQSLQAPGGTVAEVLAGSRQKGVQGLTQIEAAEKEVLELREKADASERSGFDNLIRDIAALKAEVIAVVTGQKR